MRIPTTTWRKWKYVQHPQQGRGNWRHPAAVQIVVHNVHFVHNVLRAIWVASDDGRFLLLSNIYFRNLFFHRQSSCLLSRVVDPDPSWIQIQKLCGTGSGFNTVIKRKQNRLTNENTPSFLHVPLFLKIKKKDFFRIYTAVKKVPRKVYYFATFLWFSAAEILCVKL